MSLNKQFPALLEQYLNNNLSPEEEKLFVAMLRTGEYEQWVAWDIQQKLESDYKAGDALDKRVSDNILQAIIGTEQQHTTALIKRLQDKWWRYAAVVLLVFGVGLYALLHDKPSAVISEITIAKEDVAPGGNQATLTLADGTIIHLDSVQNGILAHQGNSEIIKLPHGQIAYSDNGRGGMAIELNTMSTPRGGQYKLILPDGTKVWLNAASSITYPTAFNARFRNVKITGEAYFEVAAVKANNGDKSNIPFFVDVDGKTTIAVLGTRFNVNSYEDEKGIRTTLLEGAVKVAPSALKGAPGQDLRKQIIFQSEAAVMLRPGQQANVALTNGGKTASREIIVTNEPNLNKIIAWKEGFFDFEQVNLETVMRQVARWYDIEIVYEGEMPNRHFEGKMDRGLTLSQVVAIFQETGMKLRLEDKKLYVSR